MRYALIAQVYWPAWFALCCAGHTWLGMIFGACLVVACWAICWRIEFGTWRLGK